MILDFYSWKLNEELSEVEKKIFSLWKKTFLISQKKVSGENAKMFQKNQIADLNDQIKSIIGKDEKLKSFFDDIKDRVSLNKKQDSFEQLKNKEDKTAEDYQKIKQLKAEIKELNTDDTE